MNDEALKYWIGVIVILFLSTVLYFLMIYLFPLHHLSWLSTLGIMWIIISLKVGIEMHFKN